jgi:hypothetical protein
MIFSSQNRYLKSRHLQNRAIKVYPEQNRRNRKEVGLWQYGNTLQKKEEKTQVSRDRICL